MKVYGIILGAGDGKRMGISVPKQFLELCGRPVIAYTLEAFSIHPRIDAILVVTHPDYVQRTREIVDEHRISKVADVIPGGSERYDSSCIAVTHLDYDPDDILIIHDAVRPFITHRIIDDCIDCTAEHGASDVAVKTTDTIAEVQQGFVTGIPERGVLYNGQTPQSFRHKVILDAHEQRIKEGFTGSTDDVTLALRAGYKVKLVEGDYENIKITTAADIELAETIVRKRTADRQCP